MSKVFTKHIANKCQSLPSSEYHHNNIVIIKEKLQNGFILSLYDLIISCYQLLTNYDILYSIQSFFIYIFCYSY